MKSDMIMAPVAGFSDPGFRFLCAAFGAGLVFTEMVSMKGLAYGNENTRVLLRQYAGESPSAVQIFGCDSEIMAKMCLAPEVAAFDIVDINMGCPVPKIFNNGEGSALMKDIKLAEKVISAVRKNVKNLTVKFRAGVDDGNRNAVEFAKMCEGAGADAVTVHGRTRVQFFSGEADLGIIADVVNAVNIPVIGNGDIGHRAGETSPARGASGSYGREAVDGRCTDEEARLAAHIARVRRDAENMKARTGCAGVMIARGAFGRPYVFSDSAADAISRLGAFSDGNYNLIYTMAAKHIEILNEIYPDAFTAAHMRHHLAWYLKGVSGGHALKSEINRLDSTAAILERLKTV